MAEKDNYEEDVEQCIAVLRRGGLILYPTDTVWGIGCDATNAAAVEKIFNLKHRPVERSMIVLVAGQADVLNYADRVDPSVFRYLETTERPTSVVYSRAKGLAPGLINGDGSIAIRISRDEFCKALVTRFGKPIVSTSANVSGQPAPSNYAEVTDEIKSGVDYCVEYRRHDKTKAIPSAVIKWECGGPIVIRS